jgi:O-antigen/teichoic acid export membrane protein
LIPPQPTTAPREPDSVRSRLPAGILDASFASLATFVAGLVAVNILDGPDLGIYAVFFAAFTFGQLVAYQLIYVPAEIVAVSLRGRARLAIFDDSIRLGLAPSFAGAALVFVAALSTAPLASAPLTAGLTVTAFSATLLSPTQDHIRRTLHIANRSWHAAAMSLTQFLVTVGATGIMLVLDVSVYWIPFGALTAANFLSIVLGALLVAHDRQHAKAHDRVGFSQLVSQGRWLLLQAAIPAGAAFVTANIITYLAGPTVMGYAEAARIVAQPIVVLAAGLIYPLRPRAMEAALDRDLAASSRVERVYVFLVVAGGLAYLPLAGGAWFWNPMQHLVPAAYEVSGLVAATVAANIVLASVFLLVNEMMAADRGRLLALLNGIAAGIRIMVALTAGLIGAFARPLSEGTGELSVVVGLLRERRRFYRPAAESAAVPPA